MLLPHGGWPMAAGPASRLGSIEPGDKTGLRRSPHLKVWLASLSQPDFRKSEKKSEKKSESK